MSSWERLLAFIGLTLAIGIIIFAVYRLWQKLIGGLYKDYKKSRKIEGKGEANKTLLLFFVTYHRALYALIGLAIFVFILGVLVMGGVIALVRGVNC